MSGEYQARLKSRLEQRATSHSGTVALILLATLPVALGLLQQARLSISAPAAGIVGQNAAATAAALGNQAPHPALETGGKSMLGANGDVLALCSGTSGAKPVVHLNCATLSSTIQR